MWKIQKYTLWNGENKINLLFFIPIALIAGCFAGFSIAYFIYYERKLRKMRKPDDKQN